MRKKGNLKKKVRLGAAPNCKISSKTDDPLGTQSVDIKHDENIPFNEMTCRICLAENPESSVSVFSLFEDQTVAQIMSYCTSLEVEKDDQLPKIVCDTCFLKIEAAKKLKDTSIISDKILRKSLKMLSIFKDKEEEDFKDIEFLNIKTEPIEMLPINSYDVKDEPKENNEEVPKTKQKKLKTPGKSQIKMLTDSYDCIDCERVFDNIAVFENHKCKISQRICSICDGKFSGKQEFLQHLRDSHFDHRTCSICNLDVRSAKALHLHLRAHQQKISYMCDICSKIFHKPLLLKAHRESHTQHYQCDLCGITVVSRPTMVMHISRIHLNASKKFKCTKCPIVFKVKESLKLHQIRAHGAKAPVNCQICPKGFMFVSQLNKHNRVTHLKLRRDEDYSSYKHKCSKCHKAFKIPSGLHKHMKKHDLPHTITKKGLSLLKYECNLCEKKFPRGQMLKDHLTVHTGERPYQCKKCLMCFKIAKTLRVHLVKIHHEVSPYVSTKSNISPGNISKQL